jgi:thiamine-phosphate pyrophosphorylase
MPAATVPVARYDVQLNLPRFYPVLDTELFARRGLPVAAAAEAVLEGGARILQFRHKTFFSRDVYVEAALVAKLCDSAGSFFVMNDRADFAMLLRCWLHLGQDDLPPLDARKILPARSIIGFSTHNERQLREADREPVDYLAFGPIFETRSKQNPDPVAGVEELKRVRPFTGKPLVAIGGITRERAAAVRAAGADSIGVVNDIIPEECSKKTVRERTEEWLQLLAK